MWLIVKRVEGNNEDILVALPMPETPLVVGRSAASNLVVQDIKVSSRHVELTDSGDSVDFRDLNSRYGTLYGGTKTEAGSLKSGEFLDIGSTRLSIEAELPKSGRAARAQRAKNTPSPKAPTVEELCQIVARVRQYERPRKVLDCLLKELVGALSADRGYVLIREGVKDRLVCVASHAIDEMDDFLSLSSTVYRQAIDTGKTVTIMDSSSDPTRQRALSLSFYPSPRSILCCPLMAEKLAFGVVYLDMPTPDEGIPQAAVQVLETLAAIAAERLANTKTRYRLVAARERITALQALGWKDRRLVLGNSQSSVALRETIKMASDNDTSVLVTGETGTGKEMVARALHYASHRRTGPFVPVNCAALPSELIESELFGSEKGAYTGAGERRIGRFELAGGGTLFLDEVGELPLDAQVKLLRVLQERTLVRVGGTEEIPLDFRLICATNRTLEDSVKEGTFRADLFYRINVFRVELKPLRQKPEEIVPLAEFFLTSFAKRFGRELKGFTPDAERLLIDYEWPGNIRELRNAIERAVVVEQGDAISCDSLLIRRQTIEEQEKDGLFIGSLPHEFNSAREQFERAFLERSLAANDNNIAAVVRETGLGRPTVYRWLKRFGLRTDD